MDKNIEHLVIRACKSKKPLQRLFSIRRRFFISCVNQYPYLLIMLTEICDRYSVITTTDLLHRLSQECFCKHNALNPHNYTRTCVTILISSIRLSAIDKFPELRKPLKMC